MPLTVSQQEFIDRISVSGSVGGPVVRNDLVKMRDGMSVAEWRLIVHISRWIDDLRLDGAG